MKKFVAGLLMVCMAVLFGCGGGGGATPAAVTGTASQGAPLAAGTPVTVKDAKGKTVSTTVGANGTYSVVVDGMTAPFVINAGGVYSFAAAPGVTNVNPFTHFCMQLALGSSTINDNTVIPANFQTQFAEIVSDLKVKIDALFASSVTATQRDFLGGNISLAAGVDKVFETIVITAPNSAGVFSISVCGIQIISGTISNGACSIIQNPTAISAVNIQLYPPVVVKPVFTTAMVSGQTFTWASSDARTGTLTFNSNGSASRTQVGGTTSTGRWGINAGNLVVTTSTGEVDLLILTGSTANSFTVKDNWNDGVSNTSGTLNVTFTATTNAPASNVFTAAMVSGKTFATGVPGSSIQFKADRTSVQIVNGVQLSFAGGTYHDTWTINSAGQLLWTLSATAAGATQSITFTYTIVSGNATTGWVANGTLPGSSATVGTLAITP